ncbi:uncharacterized protein Z520_04454 [Fonsecaea multimorphosa CBS 102226]|uniref:Peptidase A2 domain-containing protein n=1 Tax=Fonsecaea multimorphosa CBS 102226 TaxID=1442371 RepID=A0A0D2KSX6_9EURO|nr:uncharacterized protein Z520_04454 [Fonsecaea multimorphosa CBS 102226]KIX99818.1 hypothetical protein Z520_04454 [Fonsecaea multimorphosa CBS 102226]OAL26478.1 hypothetical protein AYO22_04216 [Fonsecaea multimorphosa]
MARVSWRKHSSQRTFNLIRAIPQSKAMAKKPILDRLRDSVIERSFQAKTEEPDRTAGGDSDGPPKCLGKVMLMEERRRRLNLFVVLMFIHLEPKKNAKSGHRQSTTTPRRVLLDTGADFNLISDEAHTELDLKKQPYSGRVHSIGGYTDLSSTVVLQWHFRSYTSGADQTSPSYRAPFYVLPPESEAKFDCILGRPWIEENWDEFIALVELNRRKETAG